MIIQGSYNLLLNIQRDIEKQRQASPAYEYFNHSKIKAFYNKNAQRLEILRKNMARLMDDHVLKDAKNEPVTAHVDGKEQWVYKTDADKEEFEAGWEALMSKNIEIFS